MGYTARPVNSSSPGGRLAWRGWALALVALLVLAGAATLHVEGLWPAPVPEASEPFGYEGYAQVLRHVKADGRVDFGAMRRERAGLDGFVRSLATWSPRTRPELFAEPAQELAYWLNAHNALVLQQVLEEGGGASWGRSWPVGGQRLTLWALEHRILEREFADPRIHLALFHGTRGGPQLQGAPFQPEFIDAQLNDATRAFLADPRHLWIERGSVHLARVFDTWREDFLAALPEGRRGNVLQFVWAFLPDICTERPGCDNRAELDRVCGHSLDRCELVFEPEDEAPLDTALE